MLENLLGLLVFLVVLVLLRFALDRVEESVLAECEILLLMQMVFHDLPNFQHFVQLGL